MNKQLIITVIIAVGILGFGGWYFFTSQPIEVKSPETAKPQVLEDQASTAEPTPSTAEKVTARSFAETVLQLLQNRDHGKIYDLVTDEIKATEDKTEYVKRMTETSGTATITSWQINEVLEGQVGASVQYVANYIDPVRGPGSVTGLLTLVQQNGKWFLSIGTIDAERAVVKGLGDEILLATIKFKINAVREQQTISNQYGNSATAKKGTKFIVIDMSITNTTNASFTFPDYVFVLADNQDRRFDIYDNTSIDNYLNRRQLASGITERGVVVYEIPLDAAGYSFTMGKIGTNEAYKVILK